MLKLQTVSTRLFAATASVMVSALFLATAIAPVTNTVALSGAIA
ncbi:MAG: hypothetical protein WA908_12515 [Pontixanthobacter sp.]